MLLALSGGNIRDSSGSRKRCQIMLTAPILIRA
ncbi:hypothetical protein T296_19980 [Pantoea agglomerans Eh318]|nr:hypothetical protein T296_19980 [Pantoea agglomerans Eh318]